MERVALLTARIALYRRYLAEGADGDLARTYLRLIKQDEAELRAHADIGQRQGDQEHDQQDERPA